jgi:hypothetical protein
LFDNSSDRRYWGYAGHYYTPYFILRLAGVPDGTAQKVAFYAQLPDEVLELDATHAGKELAGAKISLSMSAGMWGQGGYVSPEVFKWSEDAQRHSHDIQRGLHALTGRNRKEEVRIREAVLKNQKLGSIEFGLALHAFGDSFAHQDKTHDRMYNPGWGHTKPTLVLTHLPKLAKWFGIDPEMPDAIDARAGDYIEYGSRLYDIIVELTPNTTNRPLALISKDKNDQHERLRKYLLEVAQEETDAAQAKKLIEISSRAELKITIKSYDPQGREPLADAVDAKKFSEKYPTLVSQEMIKKAVKTGVSWSWKK